MYEHGRMEIGQVPLFSNDLYKEMLAELCSTLLCYRLVIGMNNFEIKMIF